MLYEFRQSLKWFLHDRLGKPVLMNGHPIRLPRGLIPSFTVRKPNVYEAEVCAVLDHWLRPGDTFVDVGANIGMLSLHASRLVGADGSVVACEPNPFSAVNLVELFRANRVLERLALLPVAIGEEEQMLSLSVSTLGSPTMGRSSVVHHDPGATLLRVPAIRLDRFLGTFRGVRLMKIDVEGAEVAVLRGAREILAKHQPAVCLELHGLYYDPPARIVEPVFEFLAALGYGVWNLLTGQRQEAADFLRDSGCPGIDPLTGRAYREIGYGQLLAAPLAGAPGVESFLQRAAGAS